MTSPQVRCRLAACKVESGWDYYLINASSFSVDLAVLTEVVWWAGGSGSTDRPNREVVDIGPGEHALLLRDDGSGAELTMLTTVVVHAGALKETLVFDLPKLYRRRNLDLVEGLGLLGVVFQSGYRP